MKINPSPKMETGMRTKGKGGIRENRKGQVGEKRKGRSINIRKWGRRRRIRRRGG